MKTSFSFFQESAANKPGMTVQHCISHRSSITPDPPGLLCYFAGHQLQQGNAVRSSALHVLNYRLNVHFSNSDYKGSPTSVNWVHNAAYCHAERLLQPNQSLGMVITAIATACSEQKVVSGLAADICPTCTVENWEANPLAWRMELRTFSYYFNHKSTPSRIAKLHNSSLYYRPAIQIPQLTGCQHGYRTSQFCCKRKCTSCHAT